jgi:biotin carboxyl carrier protein
MKYAVKIGEQTFSVEIKDINARPIVAVVDGEAFEVIPQSGEQAEGNLNRLENVEAVKTPEIRMKVPAAAPASNLASTSNTLTAPLPGTVIEIFVHAGNVIESGQVVLIIEAMKMKNSIRATRGGTIAEVLVSAGQSVAHKQALVIFEG